MSAMDTSPVKGEPAKEEPAKEEPVKEDPAAAEESPAADPPPAVAAESTAEPKAEEPKAEEPTTEEGKADDDQAEQQRQLVEFNQWLYRWNNYQQHLANYWQGRYHALYLQVGGGGKVSKKGKKLKAGKGDLGSGKTGGKWQLRFQELLEFKEEHGHTNVPKEFTYKYSPPLGHWVGRMRHLHKKGTLAPERHLQLDQIDFEFVITKSDKINFSVVWDKSYQALKAFKDTNGHLEVPNGYKPQPDMAELDGWITRQRKHYKDGRLPDHLTNKLKAIGLNFGGRGRPFGVESGDTFTRNYKALVEYSNEHGDCDVPEKYDGDRELGSWCKAQRDTYAEGMLPDDRVKSLNQVGFNFYHGRKSDRTKTSDPWQRRIEELKAYKEKTGNTNVPKKFPLNLGLGDFVYNQRMAYKDENLSEEKVKCLTDLGFEWSIKRTRDRRNKKKTNWELRFEELEEYKAKHGNLDVPKDYAANPKLAAWTKRQRKYRREGVMKDEKFERLQALGLDFGGPKQEKKPWMEQYESLVEFRKEHGHNDVPVHYPANPPLYYWMGTQKQSHKKGKLAEDKLKLLQEIDFNFAAKTRDRTPKKGTRNGNKPFLDPDEFEKLMSELFQYKEEHGHIDVPQREGRLGSFVHYMRFYVKGGKLSDEHIARLDELGFSWNVTSDRWNAKYENLSKFKEKHGSFDIPSGHALYSWVGYQRKLYQEGSLPQDRVVLLQNIDFDFATPLPKRGAFSKESAESWEERYQELVAFKTEHGHCKVNILEEPILAKWVSAQQNKYKKGSLSDDLIDRLYEIDFNFTKDTKPKLGVLKIPKLEPVDRESYLEDLWDKSYQELSAYKDHFGHCNIPISYEGNPSLGAWAFSQKMAFKKDKLSQERYDKLNALEFPFVPQKKVIEEV